jgi:hypothetical protein
VPEEGLEEKGQPQPVAGLGELLAQLQGLPGVRVGALWAAAAGPLLARHSRAVAGGAQWLRVECSGEDWRSQLAAMERELLTRLHELGLGELERLELTLTAPAPPEPRPRERKSLAPDRVLEIEAAVRGVSSVPVRQALERLLLRKAQDGSLELPEKEEP